MPILCFSLLLLFLYFTYLAFSLPCAFLSIFFFALYFSLYVAYLAFSLLCAFLSMLLILLFLCSVLFFLFCLSCFFCSVLFSLCLDSSLLYVSLSMFLFLFFYFLFSLLRTFLCVPVSFFRENFDDDAPFLWRKSPTICNVHLPESNFQTRSGKTLFSSGKNRQR